MKMAAAGVPPGSFWNADIKPSMSETVVACNDKANGCQHDSTDSRVENRKDSVSAQLKKKGKKSSCVWKVFTQIPISKKSGCPQTQCSVCKEVCRNPCGSTTAMRNHLSRKHPKIWSIISKGLELPSPSTISAMSSSPPLTVDDIKQEVVSDEEDPDHQSEFTNNLTSVPDNGSNRAVVATTDNVNISRSSQSLDHGLSLSVTTVPSTYTSSCSDTVHLHPLVADNLDKYRSIATMCILNLLPLNTITTPSFRAMMISFEGGIPIPCNDVFLKIVSKHIDTMYENQKRALLEELTGQQICVTVECFKHSHLDCMVMYTANYLLSQEDKKGTKWVFTSKFLGVQLLPIFTSESVEDMKPQIISGMRELLGPSRKSSVLPDLVLNMGTVYDIANVVQFEPSLSIPCFCEILDGALTFISQHGVFANVSYVVAEISNLKCFQRKYSRSELEVGEILASRHMFETHCVALGCSWQNLIDYANAIADVINIIDTLLLEQPGLIPLSIVLPLVVRLRIQFERKFKIVAPELHGKLENFIVGSYGLHRVDGKGQCVLAMASFFHPRYKNLQFADIGVSILVNERVKSIMERTGPRSSRRSRGVPRSRVSSMSLDAMAISGNSPGDESENNSWQNEYDKYIQVLPETKTDLYLWWQENQEEFPILYKIAKRYVCVRGSAVTAKQAFRFECANANTELFNKFQDIEPEYWKKYMFLNKSYPSNYFDIDQPPELCSEVKQLCLINSVKEEELEPDSIEHDDSGIVV
ncbi:unnamed protein product [Orchesella dallaii]|uniref:BED-type domain-containing protein n=1 Tax=Orchesella dallaii TaxID=48710 RepID=A0ABP1QEP5_9HEXA